MDERVGRAVRFYNSELEDAGTRYDGFDAGSNLGGEDVYVTADVLLRNAFDDLRLDAAFNGGNIDLDGDLAEIWGQTLVSAATGAVEGPNGLTLYPLFGCNLAFDGFDADLYWLVMEPVRERRRAETLHLLGPLTPA